MIRSLLSFAVAGMLLLPAAMAQSSDGKLPLEDLSAFRTPGSNWQIVGSASASLDTDNELLTQPGKGVLVNLPGSQAQEDLYSAFEHGDVDLELEFMMARNSNSGIYLQGQYEIQLLDSHGKTTVTYGDCGGIYQRWDEARGQGNQGFEGQAPRAQVTKAPGLWQKLTISFQAPRFSASGARISPAKILLVTLNGHPIHEQVTLSGPTRGSDKPHDIPMGPLRIQGDHGPVAFRNVRIRTYDLATIETKDLQYQVFTGAYDQLPALSTLQPVASGTMEALTSEVIQENDKFITNITGKLVLPRDGRYEVDLNTLGNGQLFVDGKEVIPYGWWEQQGSFEGIAGEIPFQLIYHKRDSWYNNGIALSVSGPGMRSQPLHLRSSMPLSSPVNPIFVDVTDQTTLMRCFIDYSEADYSRRVVHAVSVGSPSGLHYTYDPDRATLVQGWRGDFLDATPMWHDRGDGSSRPRGAVEVFGDKAGVAYSAGNQMAWPEEVPADLGYHFEGYRLNASKEPVFLYKLGDAQVADHWQALSTRTGLQRTVELNGKAPAGALLKLAEGVDIQQVGKTSSGMTYLVDQRFYLHLPVAASASVVQRAGRSFLVVDLSNVSQQLQYSLQW